MMYGSDFDDHYCVVSVGIVSRELDCETAVIDVPSTSVVYSVGGCTDLAMAEFSRNVWCLDSDSAVSSEGVSVGNCAVVMSDLSVLVDLSHVASCDESVWSCVAAVVGGRASLVEGLIPCEGDCGLCALETCVWSVVEGRLSVDVDDFEVPDVLSVEVACVP